LTCSDEGFPLLI